jgi:hypothetical protein
MVATMQTEIGQVPTVTPQALGESINMERRKGAHAMHDWKYPSENQNNNKRGQQV